MRELRREAHEPRMRNAVSRWLSVLWIARMIQVNDDQSQPGQPGTAAAQSVSKWIQGSGVASRQKDPAAAARKGNVDLPRRIVGIGKADHARNPKRPRKRQHRTFGIVGRGVVNTGMVGAVKNEPGAGIGRCRHIRIADPKEKRPSAAWRKCQMPRQLLDIAGFETIVDDGAVAIALADPADRPGLPGERPGEGGADTGIDRLVVRMGVRMEIDDPQKQIPPNCPGHREPQPSL